MAVEKQQRTFQDIQAEYDQLFRDEPIRDDDRGYRWHAQQVLKQRKHYDHILDLACGGGFFLKQLAQMAGERIGRISGSDLSGEALELARREYPQAKLMLAAAESLPVADNTYDAIICLGSLEHFLDVGSAVAEMKRVTKRDGLFFILVPNLFWYKDLLAVLFKGTRLTRNQTHERFAAMGEWQELFASLGLRVVKTVKYNGVAKNSWKQCLKDLIIPLRFSYHFMFICQPAEV
ncbi:MAG: class I SAM-dependent methyltransferase [Candidatus Omnitrophota bacterium]|nr:class I SAM-dependent methyltransferase [Candidatus Omnitrophota bacterium]